jgi:DNA invertase Pin-like site-specific DNA recombinase
MVDRYARQHGATVVGEYTEIESGKRCNRPEIAKAIAQCKREGATLVVAKLDRLARNVAFTSALMDSGCEFVACDNPHATRLTIHILAAVAEHEALETSRRTKIALAARKAKGLPKITPPPATAAKGRQANAAKAAEHAATVLPIAQAKRSLGWTLEQIAHHLTGKGHLTRFNKPWTITAVLRLLAKAA